MKTFDLDLDRIEVKSQRQKVECEIILSIKTNFEEIG